MTERQQANFLRRIVAQSDGCWVSTYAKFKGYARVTLRYSGSRVSRVAHRLAYEYFIGEVPQGLDLDHLCRNRACVNPTHLEPVSRRENCQRGLMGALITDEVRERFASTKRGKPRPWTPEWRAKFKGAWVGRRHTPETRAKMADARRRYWAGKRSAA